MPDVFWLGNSSLMRNDELQASERRKQSEKCTFLLITHITHKFNKAPRNTKEEERAREKTIGGFEANSRSEN
jgi:hypothetical protein